MWLVALLVAIWLSILAWRHWPLAVSLLACLLPTYLLRFRIGPLPMTVLEELIFADLGGISSTEVTSLENTFSLYPNPVS